VVQEFVGKKMHEPDTAGGLDAHARLAEEEEVDHGRKVKFACAGVAECQRERVTSHVHTTLGACIRARLTNIYKHAWLF
jgi:signal transduction histidine kinase